MTVDASQFESRIQDSANGLREVLPYNRMQEIADSRAVKYANAQPYPHTVIDGFFDDWILDTILAEFPGPTDEIWERHEFPEEIKLQSKDERHIPLFTRQFLYALNSASFLRFLQQLTGIEKLVGDPQFEGGGLHQIRAGGKLAIHADFNKDGYYGLDRRLNMLVYLNKDWKEEYGGHFELWDPEMKTMIAKVAPVFNRVVIFSTTRYSYHGHPDPLNCPPNMTRRSLALYYYTIGQASGEGDDARHGTLFQRRPGEKFRHSGKQLARDLTPPVIWRLLSRSFGS
jgi:Rps23 Pro-64 3,4-dihydroxylase Tpa1-like proline 4-hydroxylase